MYIHSVKLLNYKSIGDYDEAEVILEHKITAIIGKNETGKSNILEGLSEIDFVGNKSSGYSSEKINRSALEGSEIKYEVIIKPTTSDAAIGIVGTTKIILSKGHYKITGGLCTHYYNTVLPHINTLNSVITSLSSQPFKSRDSNLAGYRSAAAALASTTSTDIPEISNALTYFKSRQDCVPAERRSEFINCITTVENNIHEFLSLLPIFFYRRMDKNLKTFYKLEDVKKELESNKSSSLLSDLLTVLDISASEFINAVRTGNSGPQITARDRIIRFVENKINQPFQQFYQTEKIRLKPDFNADGVSFAVQSGDGAALLFDERSNGLRWYLETFIDAQAHNISGRNVVYLFDEPGISLHVNAQKELLNLFNHLANQGNQIVYTTHSPYLLNIEDYGLQHIRAVVKDSNGYTQIYKTAYDTRIAPNAQKDTLAPIINALGMSLNDTFGPAKDKINIVTEGMSDYIYLCMMAKELNVDKTKYVIIPSFGASNCINICSILHGWGCKFIAVFDYDKAGVESGGEHMRKNLFYELNKEYCYLSDVRQQDVDNKTYKINKCEIEDVVTREEIERFYTSNNVSQTVGKPLTAKMISSALNEGLYEIGEECLNNFRSLFSRIFSYVE